VIRDRPGESWALNSLANLALYQGDYPAATSLYEQALEIKREIGDRKGEGGLLNNIGIISLEQGRLGMARCCLDQSLVISREVGDRQVEANALINLGLFSLTVGDYEEAGIYLDRAMSITCDIGDRQGECWALAYLGLLAHHRGQNAVARRYSSRALEVAQNLGNRSIQAYALTNLGHAEADRGFWAEAAEAYQEAMDLRRELGRCNLAVESQAGLAGALLARGRQRQAQANVDEVLDYIAGCSLDGTEDRFRIYLTCYQVLQSSQDARAGELLDGAYEELQAWAGRIDDPRQRNAFLEDVAAHRELQAAWHSLQCRRAQGQVVVRLARAAAPTGRPLHGDEWVSVAWHPALPGDDDIPDPRARRRQRLQRLLEEAAAQGAAPTVTDLAGALQTPLRTLKRDLAALRAAGHPTPTRGRRDST
jgi:Tfp pilus assembly protein PilF